MKKIDNFCLSNSGKISIGSIIFFVIIIGVIVFFVSVTGTKDSKMYHVCGKDTKSDPKSGYHEAYNNTVPIEECNGFGRIYVKDGYVVKTFENKNSIYPEYHAYKG